MNVEELLNKCETVYSNRNYNKLIKLCDEVLKKDPHNQIAIGYKSVSYCFLNQPEKALEILDDGIKRYPENYYLKNNLSMVYYDLGEYEKSLKCCEEGLKIKDFDWLYENKIKALIMLDRTDEAIEVYESIDYVNCDPVDVLLFKAGKNKEVLDYYSKKN